MTAQALADGRAQDDRASGVLGRPSAADTNQFRNLSVLPET